MVCWIANDTRLFCANCFPTDRFISNWNRCSHIHWPIFFVILEHGPSKGCSGVHLLEDNASSHKCEVVKSFFASEKGKVLNHPPYSPDLSPCDQSLRKSFLEIGICLEVLLAALFYQCLQQIPKEDYSICFSRLGRKVTKMCFTKEGILKRFVIKICLIKRSTEVIRNQWQNFWQDPHIQICHSVT